MGLSVTTGGKGEVLVVGTVFRGSSWLDNILTSWVRPKTICALSIISSLIIASKQYSQLHAVILSKKDPLFGNDASIVELSHMVKLPVISIIRKKKEKNKEGKTLQKAHYEIEVHGERIHVLAKGKSLEETQELFILCSAPKSCIPEAARIADLISEQVRLKWNSLGLA